MRHPAFTYPSGLAVCALAAAILGGCGGGGGGGGDSSSLLGTTPTPTPAPTPTPTPAPTPTPTPAPTPFGATQSQTQATTVAHAIKNELDRTVAMAKSGIDLYINVYGLFLAGSMTHSCSASGSYVATVNDSGTLGVPEHGESITVTYTNCVSTGIPDVYNGTMTLSWIALSGDPTAGDTWSANYSVAYTGFTDTLSQSQVGMDGGVTYDVTSVDAVQKSGTLTYDSLQRGDYTSATPGGPYALAETTDFTGQVATYAVDATNASSLSLTNKSTVTLANSTDTYDFTYATATNVTADSSGNYTGGVFNVAIHSIGDTTLNFFTVLDTSVAATFNFKWTVIDSTTVKVEGDLNTDGTYETSHTIVGP